MHLRQPFRQGGTAIWGKSPQCHIKVAIEILFAACFVVAFKIYQNSWIRLDAIKVMNGTNPYPITPFLFFVWGLGLSMKSYNYIPGLGRDMVNINPFIS